ncbi:MAG TPA: hypothetical protein V6D29_10135 [Leptolyngbyaceae cyanobacterium]
MALHRGIGLQCPYPICIQTSEDVSAIARASSTNCNLRSHPAHPYSVIRYPILVAYLDYRNGNKA